MTATAGGATADYNYDPSGRLDTVTSGGQILQQNTYDGFDHVISHVQQNSSGGTDTTTYTYDPLNRKTAQTTGGKETDFAYLGLSSDLITESSPGPSPSPTTTPPAAPGCPRPPTTLMGRRPAATTPTTTTPTSKPSPDPAGTPPPPTATHRLRPGPWWLILDYAARLSSSRVCVISGLLHVADSVLNAPADLLHSQEPSVPTIYHVNLGGMFDSWWQHREGIAPGSANGQIMRYTSDATQIGSLLVPVGAGADALRGAGSLSDIARAGSLAEDELSALTAARSA